jgi:hypothetical protein
VSGVSAKAIERVVTKVRAICTALPEVTERLSHGEPTWFVRAKKTFVMMDSDHHDSGHVGIWCAAPAGVQQQLVDEEPTRFFVPPYVGGRGWLGVRLDVKPDWDEVAAIVEDAYRCIAPAKLVAELDQARR